MIKQTRILIVDDEVLIAEHIKDVLTSFEFENIKMVHDKRAALKEIEEFIPQLVLLDIKMEDELGGIEIGKILNSKFKTPFIYITAHSDTEITKIALATKPAGYITKPIKKTDVYAAISIAIDSVISKEVEFIIVKDGYKSIRIDTQNILYAESDGNYIHLVCKDKKYTLRYSLEWLLDNVSENEFVRVHRQYVVNLKTAKGMKGKSIIIGNYEVPVSRNNLKNLSEILLKFNQ